MKWKNKYLIKGVRIELKKIINLHMVIPKRIFRINEKDIKLDSV